METFYIIDKITPLNGTELRDVHGRMLGKHCKYPIPAFTGFRMALELLDPETNEPCNNVLTSVVRSIVDSKDGCVVKTRNTEYRFRRIDADL